MGRGLVVEALLELKDLVRHHGNVRGVGPLTLNLGPGIHGLLGPNGAGKTTLLKTLLGFLPPTSGSARVLGHDVHADSLEVRRLVGYMAENDVFVPGLNAAQTVRLAAELFGFNPNRAHEAASEALHAVGLGEEALHAPNRLSTGQRQRMKLAAALVHGPKLLFLDEPTNGLDPRGRRTMLELIREISRDRQVSVILSTHILPDVEAVCQSALVLREGKLAAHETVQRAAAAASKAARWHAVEVLGDRAQFEKACTAARMKVEDHRGVLHVEGTPDAIAKLAHANHMVLLRLMPSFEATSDRLLAHLEQGASA